MTATIDANILILAANEDSPFHERAKQLMTELLSSDEDICLFWPVIMAYLRVVTQPRLFRTPLLVSVALEYVQYLVEHSNVRMLAKTDSFFALLSNELGGDGIRGKLVHDAHLVALMRQHNVDTIYTQDSDFLKFKDITVINPFA